MTLAFATHRPCIMMDTRSKPVFCHGMPCAASRQHAPQCICPPPPPQDPLPTPHLEWQFQVKVDACCTSLDHFYQRLLHLQPDTQHSPSTSGPYSAGNNPCESQTHSYAISLSMRLLASPSLLQGPKSTGNTPLVLLHPAPYLTDTPHQNATSEQKLNTTSTQGACCIVHIKPSRAQQSKVRLVCSPIFCAWLGLP